jgi:membrane-bound serine protease (ClpP class)
VRFSRPRAFALALLLLALPLVACAREEPPARAVHVIEAAGIVNGVMERYIDRAIEQAEESNAVAVLLRIDTPGGEIGAMKGIVGRLGRSRVPVITWVGPPGAQAVSAGTFIAMAGHVAAMAPSTTIGAASPVTGTGSDIEGALGRKVTNDTVAFARGVAELHGRNADWAEAAVREAVSATPSEAVEENIVDLVAADESRVLAEVEGTEVRLLSGRRVTLQDVATAPRLANEPNVYERALGIISDPLIVSLLFLAGVIGIGIEFAAPGLFLPGTAGVIALLLAFLGVGTLLPGEAAVILLALGVLLLLLELFVPSGGVLGAGAAVAIVLGLSIALGQTSTALTLGGVLLVLGVIVATLLLLGGAAFALIARGYLARSEQSGGRLL